MSPGWRSSSLSALVVGLVGLVVPVLPGLALMWAAVGVWALLDGGGTWRWTTFAVVTVLAAVGTVAALAMTGRQAGRGRGARGGCCCVGSGRRDRRLLHDPGAWAWSSAGSARIWLAELLRLRDPRVGLGHDVGRAPGLRTRHGGPGRGRASRSCWSGRSASGSRRLPTARRAPVGADATPGRRWWPCEPARGAQCAGPASGRRGSWGRRPSRRRPEMSLFTDDARSGVRPLRACCAVPARRVGHRRRPRWPRQPRVDAATCPDRQLPRRAVVAGRRRAPQPRSPPRCAGGSTCATRSPRRPRRASRVSGTCTPRRSGIFHAVMGLHGDILVPEDRIRLAMLDAERGQGRRCPRRSTSCSDVRGTTSSRPSGTPVTAHRSVGCTR